MGQVFDRFGTLTFSNEAEVSQNFLFPLLMELLGFRRAEIIPERNIPAFQIKQNRQRSVSSKDIPLRARPDYIVSITPPQDSYVFACDSKGPDESLDDHLDQLKAYCIALEVNLLAITNGYEFRVYNANSLIFHSVGMQQLDVAFGELNKLLNRDNVVKLTDTQRLQLIDLDVALGHTADAIQAKHALQIAVNLSDFRGYLKEITQQPLSATMPDVIANAFGFMQQPAPADELYVFRSIAKHESSESSESSLSYLDLLTDEAYRSPILVIGESGIGKTNLAYQLLLDSASRCLKYYSDTVPVLVNLSLYTTSNNLVGLIHSSLTASGAIVDLPNLSDLLRRGRFLVILDGYDEVLDSLVAQIERDLTLFVSTYHECKILITTRYFRVPQIGGVRRYTLDALGEDKIEYLIQRYLGENSDLFIGELAHNDLIGIASNTLLLTLLILIFMATGKVPHTRGRILQTVIERVWEFNQTKLARFQSPLPRNVLDRLLTRLAYEALERGLAYTLDRSSVDTVIRDVLDDLEKQRTIANDVTLDIAMNNLIATGFVAQTSGGIVFWHRAFLEYFGALHLATEIEKSPGILGELIRSAKWETIIPLTINGVVDTNSFLEDLRSLNIFLAGKALAEASDADEATSKSIIDALTAKCDSKIITIRSMAVNILQEIDHPYVNDLFQSLIVENPYVDIQKSVLVALSRRTPEIARPLIYSRLEWNQGDGRWLSGGTMPSVVESLGLLGESRDVLEIARIWNRGGDLLTGWFCEQTLARAARHGPLGSATEKILVEMLISDEMRLLDKKFALAKVLAISPSLTVADVLISHLEQMQSLENGSQTLGMATVLASFHDVMVVERIQTKAFDSSLPEAVRQCFAEALSMSTADIPLEVFQNLSNDASCQVRQYGIRGLTRFPFEQVSDLVLSSLHPPSEEELRQTDYDFAWVQKAACVVLGEHQKIELLADKAFIPAFWFDWSVEILLEAIEEQQLQSMLAFVEEITRHPRFLKAQVKAAYVLANLGYIDNAVAAINRIKARHPDSYTWAWIAEGIHILPDDYAIGVLGEIWSNLDPANRGERYHLAMNVLGALSKIGTVRARDMLTPIVIQATSQNEVLLAELSLRALIRLAVPEIEDTILEIVGQADLDSSARSRAMEILGIIGSRKSIQPLMKYLADEPHFQNMSFHAIQSICRRYDELWFNGEERIDY